VPTQPPDEPLSEAQLAFMQALWDLGEGTVAEVQARLERAGRKLAPTTVATVLRRLETKGWVGHREEGRGFVYRASVSRQRATGSLLQRLTSAFFGDDVPALVSHLLDSRAVSRQDIEQIRRLIDEKADGLRDRPGEAAPPPAPLRDGNAEIEDGPGGPSGKAGGVPVKPGRAGRTR
jgi:BlaI family transcriptional regulator, penicillinase repressor